MSHTRWIEGPEEFCKIAPVWDETLTQSKDDNPFLLSDFILTWWKIYAQSSDKLLIWIEEENGRIAAGLPLMNRNGALEYPGDESSNYHHFLKLDPQREVWDSFLSSLRGRKDWSRLQFKRVVETHLCEAEQAGKKFSDWHVDIVKAGVTFITDIPPNLQDPLKIAPGRLRSQVRKAMREVTKFGPFRLEQAKSRKDVKSFLRQFIHFSKATFREREGRSAFEDSRFCRFFYDILEIFYAKGILDTQILMAGKEIVAMYFGYTLTNNMNYILATYNPEFTKNSPGHLMIYHLIELAAKRGQQQLDFYTAPYQYKKQWCTKEIPFYTVEVWQRGWKNDLMRWKITAISKLKQNIRSNETLHKILTKLKHRLKP